MVCVPCRRRRWGGGGNCPARAAAARQTGPGAVMAEPYPPPKSFHIQRWVGGRQFLVGLNGKQSSDFISWSPPSGPAMHWFRPARASRRFAAAIDRLAGKWSERVPWAWKSAGSDGDKQASRSQMTVRSAGAPTSRPPPRAKRWARGCSAACAAPACAKVTGCQGCTRPGVEHGERRLQAYHTHQTLLQSPALLLCAVGGVVCGNHVNGTVQKPLQQSLTVLLRPDGRIHLKPAILLEHAVMFQQVVRASLTGDIQALCLRLADQSHGLLSRDMTHVVGASRLLHQAQIPGHRPPLALRANPPVPMEAGIDSIVNVPPAATGGCPHSGLPPPCPGVWPPA